MNLIEQAIKEANKSVPEAVSSELYNAALEALDDHEAHIGHPLPWRLREALRAWTDMEYRRHWGMK